jgi:cell division protein FtsQ
VVAIVVLLLGILGGGWLWLRDSSLVSVQQVSVTGATGPDAAQISSDLTAAARRMTTLDVNLGRLRAAVARYPVVADLRVKSHFPHRMQIRVVERIPVGTATVNGRQVAVSADGMILADVPVSGSLPVVTGAGSIRDGHLASWGGYEVALLAAAPDAVLPKLSQVSVDPTHGLAAQFRNGPVIYFGDSGELSAKWTSAVAVLADPGSDGAAYIDVTDPHRPAAGVGSDSASGAGNAASTAAAAQTTAGTGSGTAAQSGTGVSTGP